MNSYAVNRARWSTLSIFEQMGNIYSEVGRAFKAKNNHDLKSCQLSTDRATDLFDATIEYLEDTKSPRVKEVQLSKDQFLQVMHKAIDKQEMASLDRYFQSFAIAARLDR